MRTSIRDVARQAGVCPMTVSNVLNGRAKRASAETRQRVLQAARTMNYMPVAQPSTQRRHVETRIIGLVYDRIGWDGFWGARTHEGLRDGALEHGYDLLTILRQDPQRPVDQQELRFMDRRSDGLIFLAPQGRDHLFRMLVEHEVPTVSCYADDVPPGIAHVMVDNEGAMRLAVRHLVGYGHRRILFVNHERPRSDFDHRREGYRDAMAAAGLEPHELLVDKVQKWQELVVREIATRCPTAIICVNDWTALHLRTSLLAAGRRVPEDISLVGMDDEPAAEAAGLTTIRISGVEVGRCAMQAMMRLIAGADAASCHQTLPSRLIERATVAAPGQ